MIRTKTKPKKEGLCIEHKWQDEHRKFLESRGAHRLDMLRTNQSFLLADVLAGYTSSNGRRMVSVDKQLAGAQKFAASPLSSYSIVGVSSFPSDLKARQVAMFFLSAAVHAWSKERRESNRMPPLWHRVLGGFGDPLLDRHKDSGVPSFLVISNIAENSTNYKVEKVRDLLEVYRGVPTILVIAGSTPLDFFHNKLHHAFDLGLQIGSSSKSGALPADL